MAAAKSKKSPVQGHAMPRWTPQEMKALKAAVRESRTHKDAFAQIAADTNRNVGTVAAKYYAMHRGKKTKTPTASPKMTTQPPRGLYVRSMTLEELVNATSTIKAEIARRQEELGAQLKRLQELQP